MTTQKKIEELEKRLDVILQRMARIEEHKDFVTKQKNKNAKGRKLPTQAEIHKRIDRRFKTKTT